jgi:uncharacterized protein (TIGR00369 family)
MTSTPAHSGMPEHFGIRITDAKKDKLVGELDVDDRHLNNSGHVHGGALAAFADDLGGKLAGLNVPPGFRTTTIESKTNIFRALRARTADRRCCAGPCGAAHDRPANLHTPLGRQACRNDDPDSDGAPKGVGDTSR